jgi:hypothetical protein
MPASDTREERRGGRLLAVLFWAGVGLAPLAALVLLVGQGEGPLRVAAVLAVLAVVLIGLSITLRRDAETVRLDLEETVLEEIDMLRKDVRQDIATAARATHTALGERVQLLHETVDVLRAELQSVRAAAARGGFERPDVGAAAVPHVGMAPAAAGVGHVTAGMAQASHPHVAGAPGHQQPPGPVPGRARVPTGVVRHTETVQVTTRQTIVDPHADDAGRGTVYGGDHAYSAAVPEPPPGEWSPAPAAPRARRAAEPNEESWTEQRLRERLGERAGDVPRPRPYDRNEDPAVDDRWADMRAGDRWASLRSDERGQELRMGERRAAMHSDESGTELRIEDRWESVRREESRRAESRREESRRAESRHAESRHAESRHAERWSGDESPVRADGRRGGEDGDSWFAGQWSQRNGSAALPAGGVDTAGTWVSGGSSWDEPEPEPEPTWRGHRYRDDDYRYASHAAPDDESRGRSRRLDFEMSDERWR